MRGLLLLMLALYIVFTGSSLGDIIQHADDMIGYLANLYAHVLRSIHTMLLQ